MIEAMELEEGECYKNGFMPSLTCDSCDKLTKFDLNPLMAQCRNCCKIIEVEEKVKNNFYLICTL